MKNSLAIVGAGMIAGRFPERSGRLLQAEAARLAIEDAGLAVSQVDGAIDVKIAPGGGDVPTNTDAFPRVLGMPCRLFLTVARGAVASMLGLAAAAKYLELGLADYIVLATGVKDWSRSQQGKKEGKRGWNMIEKLGYWGKPFGDLSAPHHHGFFAQRHMHEFGTRPEAFGAIAVAHRQWAQLNPQAQMRGRPVTLDAYMASPEIVSPYRLLDMCVVSDGAAAIVVTTPERARDCAQTAVDVQGIGFGEAMEKDWWDRANYVRLAVDTAKAAAFRQADIDIADIDVAGLYDCFTAEVLFQIEDYGWCAKGEGGAFVAEGRTAPGGSLPLNTSGGLLSAYHLGEWTHLIEVVRQLRGQAGERQVSNARLGLVSGHGGEILSPGMCSAHGTLVLART